MTITNDGATTLSLMRVQHPAAKLMVQLSCAMDERAGDGTTSVVVLCAALLGASRELIDRRGLHVHQVMAGLAVASEIAMRQVRAIGTPLTTSVETTMSTEAEADKAAGRMLRAAADTALNSKMSSAAAQRLGSLAAAAAGKVKNLTVA